jgi:hypothetical protein
MKKVAQRQRSRKKRKETEEEEGVIHINIDVYDVYDKSRNLGKLL